MNMKKLIESVDKLSETAEKKVVAEGYFDKDEEDNQLQMDANRRGRLNRERGGSDKIDAMLRQQNDKLAQYNQTGKFWLKQKDTQEHLSDSFTGKEAANQAARDLLKQRPELKGNLLITAYGPGEKQGVAEATGDSKFDTMMGNIAKPSAVKSLGREEKVHELIRKYFWHKRRADQGSAVTGEHGHDRMAQKMLMALKKMNVDLSTMDPSKLKAIKGEVYEQGVAEASRSSIDNKDKTNIKNKISQLELQMKKPDADKTMIQKQLATMKKKLQMLNRGLD